MNLIKVTYWNQLRSQLNLWLIIFSVIIIGISWLLPKGKIYSSYFMDGGFSSQLVITAVALAIHIAVANFILLLLEVVDRTANFKEVSMLKNYFRWLVLFLFLFLPFLQVLATALEVI